MNDIRSLLGAEWQTLQSQYEHHEKNALLIKLTCVVLCVAGIAADVPNAWLAFTVILLWVQEGIIKTYQARLSTRLLVVESLLRAADTMAHTAPPMQLHSDWASQRPNGAGLIVSYALSASRPTVAFPYFVLLMGGWAIL